MRALASFAASFARTPGLMALSSMCSYTPSRLSKRWMRSRAVFSPTPGTPGMLSEVSPIRLFTSMSCLGFTPYFSTTAASSITTVSLRPIRVAAKSTVTCSFTSCRLSRSPVAMRQSSPRAAAAAERVPSRSSAS